MSREPQAGGEQFPRGMAFRTTHWSVIHAARQEDAAAAREALAKLCATYWYPLYGFVRGCGFGPHDAEDLTQEFFYQFLERDSLKNVSAGAGKFRSFLLACLKHFLANERERTHAQRRGGGVKAIPLDGGEAETRYSLEPAHNVTPEVLFERRWALSVLERTMQQLQEEYAKRKKSDLFEDLKGFLPSGQGNVSRAELGERRGMSGGAVDVAVHRLRQRFGALLREHVAQTVSSEAEVDEEIRYLISVLGS